MTLAKIRSRARAHRRLDEQDWKRVQALEAAALEKQNEALGSLIATMKRVGLWEDALFVMTSDVAPGDPPTVPWDPAGSLAEERLIVPLVANEFGEGNCRW